MLSKIILALLLFQIDLFLWGILCYFALLLYRRQRKDTSLSQTLHTLTRKKAVIALLLCECFHLPLTLLLLQGYRLLVGDSSAVGWYALICALLILMRSVLTIRYLPSLRQEC